MPPCLEGRGRFGASTLVVGKKMSPADGRFQVKERVRVGRKCACVRERQRVKENVCAGARERVCVRERAYACVRERVRVREST